MIRKHIVNGFFKLALGIASVFDLKLAVILMEHKMKLKTVHKDEKENDRYFDPSQFINGNLYIKDKANPIEFKETDDKSELISSEKYKKFYDIDILEKIANISKGSVSVKGWTAMLVLLVISTTINIFLFMMMSG